MALELNPELQDKLCYAMYVLPLCGSAICNDMHMVHGRFYWSQKNEERTRADVPMTDNIVLKVFVQ